MQEERKIVYVGKIPDGYTRRELRRRFERFGKIEEVSVHFREGRYVDLDLPFWKKKMKWRVRNVTDG